ncbi:MAG TPA: hypothetical protein VKR56_15840 [Candidatus Cybelea sp.]|nr:hypothetical protein [Candidatus Cybelea sp.]
MSLKTHAKLLTLAGIVGLVATACAGNNDSTPPTASVPMAAQGNHQGQGGNGQGQNGQGGDCNDDQGGGNGHCSILKRLKDQVVIGSTIDGTYGQLNPYGLDVAKSTNGAFTKGDLAVCNFNNNQNIQGTGYTIVALHPQPGSTPTLVVADPTDLVGCAALALTSNDTIYAAAFSSNDNPVYSASGTLVTNLSGSPFNDPFGETYAQPKWGSPVVYESNAADGNIIRISTGSSYSSEVIATGFPVNGGAPGSILGPSGLQYDPDHDALFVVDGDNNTVTVIENVSQAHSGCLIVSNRGKKFDGGCGPRTKLLYSGAPLNGPISSALLFNGNLVVGNTLDPNGENLMIEISPEGKVLDKRNVDTGAAGALFGMVATGTNAHNTKLFFNDDNDNDLQVLEP